MASRLKTIQGSTNPILGSLCVGYRHAKHIGRLVIPVVPTYQESGTLFTFGKEGFYIYDTERALRANAKKIKFAISSDTYRCVEHALETSLDWKELEAAQKYGAKEVLNLEGRENSLVWKAQDVKLEKTVADIVFSTTYYASGNKVTLTGDDKWSSANSDPVGQLLTARKAARADMGVEPNTLVLGYLSFWDLCNHAQIKAMVSDNKDKKVVMNHADLAALLKFDNVYVGESVYATDAGVFTDLWTDNAALIYKPVAGELAQGTTPHSVILEEMGYPEVKTYDEKDVKSYRTTRKHQVKNISTSYGYLIIDCN